MIKSKEGTVTIEGTEQQILAETMGILEAVYRMLLKNHDEEHAKARIESLGKILVAHEKEKRKSMLRDRLN